MRKDKHVCHGFLPLSPLFAFYSVAPAVTVSCSVYFCKYLYSTQSLPHAAAKLVLTERMSDAVQWMHTSPRIAFYREEGGAAGGLRLPTEEPVQPAGSWRLVTQRERHERARNVVKSKSIKGECRFHTG